MTAQVRPCDLGPQPLGVVPGGDQELGGGVVADAVEGQQAGGAGGHQRDDQRIEAVQLAVEERHPPSQLAQAQPALRQADWSAPGGPGVPLQAPVLPLPPWQGSRDGRWPLPRGRVLRG